MAPTNKPLVPPPPSLGGDSSDAPALSKPSAPRVDEDVDEPEAGARSGAAPELSTDTASTGESPAAGGSEGGEEAFGSLIDVLHAQLGRTPEVPAPIQASRRRGALPQPKAEATRASYNAGRSGGKPPPSPGVNALPSGVRPPGAPDPLEPEDTGVLIASAVAALTAGDTAQAEPESEDVAPVPAPSSAALGAAASSATLASSDKAAAIATHPSGSEGRTKTVWIGAAALLGVAAVWWLWPRAADDAQRTEPVARAAVADRDAHTATPPEASADEELAAPSPSPAAPVLEVPSDEPALESATEGAAPTQEQLDGTLDDGRPPETTADPLDAEAGALHDDPDPDASAGEAKKPRSRRKKTSKPKNSAAADSAPAASAPAPTKDGPTLLAEAKAALTAGKHQSAYSLARKARGQGQRPGTLEVMAKAACRMGSEPKAKQAFGQMTISQRRGIRSECRTKGIRLGL